MRKTVAILIPCYNEEKTIFNVIEDFECQKIKNVNIEIYVYNNNSTDKSEEQIAAATRLYDNIHYCNILEKGKGNVVRKMFQNIEADVYVMVDADLTYSASDLQMLVKPLLDEAKSIDMVVGDRLSSTYYTENKRPFHNVGNKLVKWLINKIYNAQVNDIMTGYRAMSKRFVKCMAVNTNEFEIETEMTMFALKNHMSIEQMPIQYKDRPEGSTSKLNTISDGTKVLFTIAKRYILENPLKTIGAVGFVMTLIGIFTNILILSVGLVLLVTGLVGQVLSTQAQEIKTIQYGRINQEIKR